MSFPKRDIPLTWLTGLFLLNVVIRLPVIGHFLTSDEAWILCSLKDFSESKQLFSLQLWKHPPVYLGLGMLLAPTSSGFEIRMQILSLVISSGALVLFTVLFSKLYGRKIALLAGLIYTMLPATLFFDTWIKRDGLVSFFCALALLALLKRKDILAGIFFGLCLLSKETAIFFIFGFWAFILFHRPPNTVRRTVLLFWGTAFTVSSWWYLFFDSFSNHYLSFFRGASAETIGFLLPWWYYLTKLKIDLGWFGLIVLITGILAVIPNAFLKKDWGNTLNQFKRSRFLPVFMLVPGYILLSFSRGKPPWMTISFSPFLALLSAFGSLFLFKLVSQALRKITSREILHNKWIAPIVFIGLFSANTFPFSYGNHFKSMSPNLAKITLSSYEMSDVVNKNVAENEKLLILPMIFRTAPNQADPILYWNLKQVETLYFKGSHLNFAQFQKTIEKNRINWALIFPVAGSWQEDLFEDIVSEMNPAGFMFSTGYLLKVDSYWNNNKEQNKDL
ncbi:ArnT family glycosyltransferase [Thermodesulfobacteriota bacterium]